MTTSPLATPAPWSQLASAYEAEVLPTFRPFAEEALRLAGAPSGGRVADVASGPGTLALLAARAGLVVDAIDFSPEMIALLERRTEAEGLRGVHARVGDGQALPHPDQGHDAAFSLFGLMFFPDRARGFAELRRILRPGGRAVVSSWQPAERSRVITALFTAVQQSLPESAAPPAQPLPLGTEEAWRAEMEPFFAEVQVHPVSTLVEFASTDALWDSMQRSMPPVVLMRNHHGAQAWGPIAERVGALLGNSLGRGPVTLDLHAFVTVGVRR
ncbi:MAG TPA: methyltransferase domain-containing protein [Myxococcaceae bacterium]